MGVSAGSRSESQLMAFAFSFSMSMWRNIACSSCNMMCKINLFSVKPLWGFYFGIVRDDILAVIVFRKTICF